MIIKITYDDEFDIEKNEFEDITNTNLSDKEWKKLCEENFDIYDFFMDMWGEFRRNIRDSFFTSELLRDTLSEMKIN